MRILVVTPFPLFPLTHGGRVRVWGMARGLSRAGAHVDVVCPWTPSMGAKRLTREGVTIHSHMFAANILPLILGERILPPLVMLSWQPYAAGPRRLLSQFRGYDVAQFHFCANANWMGREPLGAKVVYVAHNVEQDFHRSLRRARGINSVERLEARAVANSDLIVTCTDADAARLRTLHQSTAPVVVIPQASEVRAAVDANTRAAARRSLGIADDELVLLFVGGPAHHNRQALHHLEYDILPHVRRRVRLLAVGRAAAVRSTNNQPRSQHLGFVEDLTSVLTAADAGINPVASGSGANCKVALYLGAALPVLTTPIGLRGYEHMQEHCIVAESNCFVQVIEQLPLRSTVAAPRVPLIDWHDAGARLLVEYQRLSQR